MAASRAQEYPRFVGTARGKVYHPEPGQEETEPVGFIPQVRRTHGYYESNYALQNDCGLSFGESTASAVFRADMLGTPGTNGAALLCVNELTKLAAERSCSAREAVQLMGSLAERYGFYGPDGGAGEVLTVGDTEEAWVFHILSDPSGTGALWAAQRVPDREVAVVANMFTIRALDLSDGANFLGSANLLATARAYGLWDGEGALDFTRAFSLGEYASKYYSGRRMWDGYRRFKPSVALVTEYGSLKDDAPENAWGRSVYPFSVAPDVLLSVHDAFAAHRSHYEGTAFDTTKGVAAGPFGSPDRYAAFSLNPTKHVPGDPGFGAWERTVAIYRASCVWVSAAKAGLPAALTGTIWYGSADPSKTVFVPMMVAMGEPPAPYVVGTPGKLDRRAAYWAVRYLQNLAQLRYRDMIVDINTHAATWERRGAEAVAALRRDHSDGSTIKKRLDALAEQVLAATWQLSDELMVKFADGGLTADPLPDGTISSHDLGYPAAWLRAAGFTAGPHRMGLPAVVQNPSPPAKAAAAAAAASQPRLLATPPAAFNGVGLGERAATPAPATQPIASGQLPLALAALVTLVAAAVLLAARRTARARNTSTWESAALQPDRAAPATGVGAEERAYMAM